MRQTSADSASGQAAASPVAVGDQDGEQGVLVAESARQVAVTASACVEASALAPAGQGSELVCTTGPWHEEEIALAETATEEEEGQCESEWEARRRMAAIESAHQSEKRVTI